MTYRATAIAAFTLALLLLAALVLAVPAAAAKGKPGPVCKWKDRKHPSCVVVLAPKGKAGLPVYVTPAPEFAKQA